MEEQGCCLTAFQRKLLLKHLQSHLRCEYRRRIEIMLMADAGKSQAEICTALGCAQETARYWIFMAQRGQAHLWESQPVGRPKTINDKYLARLRELIYRNPREFGYPIQRWTAHWIGKHLTQEFGIEISNRHINRLLKKMGLSTRYCHKTEKIVAVTASKEATNISIQDLQPSASSE